MTTISSPPSGGLRGQSVGTTAISSVGKEGIGLTYRGYATEDLAESQLSRFDLRVRGNKVHSIRWIVTVRIGPIGKRDSSHLMPDPKN